ncbi:UNVERIFIED_CONTAM: hypothetical protein FKN15_003431 [Acipenser sinensis]
MAPWLLAGELVLYAACFICGIITAASVTITQGEFGGRCMLYGAASYNATSRELSVSSSSSASLCYFVSAISVLISIYCFSVVLYWIYASCVDEVQRLSRRRCHVSVFPARLRLHPEHRTKQSVSVRHYGRDCKESFAFAFVANASSRRDGNQTPIAQQCDSVQVFAATFLFFLLVSGCILNIGLSSLCQSVTTAETVKR